MGQRLSTLYADQRLSVHAGLALVLGPLITPTLAVMHMWRLAKSMRARSRRPGLMSTHV